MTTFVEMRCPLDSQRMFGRLIVEHKPQIVEGNLWEFACDKCRRRNRDGRLVLHYFNVLGDHVSTRQV